LLFRVCYDGIVPLCLTLDEFDSSWLNEVGFVDFHPLL
jgi:hypothetical protein